MEESRLEKLNLQKEFNEKYDLEVDEIIPEEEFLQRDERFDTMFGDISFEELQKTILHIQLIPPVPDNVKDLFQNAKKIYLFSYFEWDLFTYAQHYSLLAIEASLRLKHEETFGEPDGYINLKAVYEQLMDRGLIDEDLKYLFEPARGLRNSFSHPTSQTITGPNALSLQRAAEGINHIWDEE